MPAWVVPTVSAVFMSGVLSVAITAVAGRRKLSAEATNVIQQAASGVVERVEADNARLREENEQIRHENRLIRQVLRDYERREERLEEALRQHVTYCRGLAAEIRGLGGHPPEAPELPDDLSTGGVPG